MNIEILQGAEQAKRAAGIAVVIDVFRAFSLECYLMSFGCHKILPVGQVETARSLKDRHPEYVLIGERHGRREHRRRRKRTCTQNCADTLLHARHQHP